MQINSISHVNFGLKYFKDMKEFLEQSKKEAAKKGELDSFEKVEEKLTECAPTNYVLRLVTLPNSNNKKGIQLYDLNTRHFSPILKEIKEGQVLNKNSIQKLITRIKDFIPEIYTGKIKPYFTE